MQQCAPSQRSAVSGHKDLSALSTSRIGRSPVICCKRVAAECQTAGNQSTGSIRKSVLGLSTSGLRKVSSMATANGDAALEGVDDLLVIGPGVLGSYAGKLWRDARPHARVIGLTNTHTNHAKLEKMGMVPMLKGDLPKGSKFVHVLFSAPPSGAEDYPGEVAAATALWDSAAPGASFVFTSSMSVCSVDDGGAVTEEHCPLVEGGAGPSTDKLLAAEAATLKAGGNVLRLVGLYHAQRGAHTFFAKQLSVARPGDYVINLLHYEDASSIAVSILSGAGTGPFKGRVFLGCDNHPITFRDMMTAFTACPLTSADQPPMDWTIPDVGPKKSKRVTNPASRLALGGWAPKYASFQEFMKQGTDVFSTL